MFPLVGGQYKSLDVLIRVDTQIRLTHMKFNCSQTHQSVTFGLQQTIQRNEKLLLFRIFKQARSHNVKYLLKLTSFLFFMSTLLRSISFCKNNYMFYHGIGKTTDFSIFVTICFQWFLYELASINFFYHIFDLRMIFKLSSRQEQFFI